MKQPFHEVMARHMTERAITREALALKLGLTRRQVNNYTLGRTIPPGDTLLSILEFLEIPAESVLLRRVS